MGKLDGLEGKVINRLLVLRSTIRKGGHLFFSCICTCGTRKEISGYHLLGGAVISCGCYNIEKTIKFNESHKLSKNPLYSVWCNIKTRCNNPKATHYKHYGGRGITMCDEWREDFQAFYNWAMENNWNPKLNVDRIDNNGHYSPENCRIVTVSQNCNNKRNNIIITYEEKTYTFTEFYRTFPTLFKVSYNTAYNRIRNGELDYLQAITTPLKKPGKKSLAGQ